MPLLKLLMSAENKLKGKYGHREKVGSLSKMQKKMDNLFLKEYKKMLKPSRSNQDEFFKSNTAPQSAGTVVHDKNTKEHLKNKVNQKDLTQLITNILATSLKLRNSTQKVLFKQKNKECQDKIHSFYSQARPSSKRYMSIPY